MKHRVILGSDPRPFIPNTLESRPPVVPDPATVDRDIVAILLFMAVLFSFLAGAVCYKVYAEPYDRAAIEEQVRTLDVEKWIAQQRCQQSPMCGVVPPKPERRPL